MVFSKCPRLSTCQEESERFGTDNVKLLDSVQCDDCHMWKTYKQGFEDGATAMANAVNNYINNDFAKSLEREIL